MAEVLIKHWQPGFNGTTAKALHQNMEPKAQERLRAFLLTHWDHTIAPLLQVSVNMETSNGPQTKDIVGSVSVVTNSVGQQNRTPHSTDPASWQAK